MNRIFKQRHLICPIAACGLLLLLATGRVMAQAPQSQRFLAPIIHLLLNESDRDHDGLTDEEEDVNGNGVVDEGETDPDDWDSDDDEMGDGWEVRHGFDPLDDEDAAGDEDGDGLSNLDEHNANTDPGEPDSDGDGATDFLEVSLGTDPNDSQAYPRTQISYGYDTRGRLVSADSRFEIPQ